MSSPLTQSLLETRKKLTAASQKLQERFLSFRDAGDEAGMRQIGENIRRIQTEDARISAEYEQMQAANKSKILEGIASGESVTDKRKVKISVPDFDISGYTRGSMPDIEREEEVVEFNPEKARKQFAELFEVPPDKINVKSGVGTKETVVLDGLGGIEAQKQYLQEKYPEVIEVNVAGSPNFIVRDNTKAKLKGEVGEYKLVFPKGIQAKDVASFASTKTFPMLAGGVSGVAGMTSGPAAIFTVPAAANVGYSSVGGIQDAIFRAGAGVDTNPSEILDRRSKEAAEGFGVDVLTGMVGSKLGASKIGKNIENELEKNLKESVELLEKKGIETSYPVAAAGGTTALEFQRRLAAGFPKMEVGKKMERVRKVLFDWQEGATKGRVVSKKPEAVAEIKSELTRVADKITRLDASLVKQANGWAERRINELMPPATNQTLLGENILKLADEAAVRGQQMKDEAYSSFYQAAAEKGVLVPKNEVLSTIDSALSTSRNDFKRNPSIDRLYREISNSDADSFSAEQLRNIVQVARDSVPANATKTADQVAVGVSKALDDKFNDVVQKNGLGEMWQETNRIFDESSLAFRRGSVGKVLADEFGAEKLAPSQMVQRVLSNEKTVADMLSAIKNTGDEEGANVLRKQLQNAYLEKVGLTSQKGIKVSQANFQPEMIDALWGKTLGGEQVKAKLKELNESLIASKVKVANIDPQDAERLLSPLPIRERERVIETIVQKSKLKENEDKLIRNKIIKRVKDGDFEMLDNVAFGSELMKARTSDVLEIAKKLPIEKRKELGMDAFAAVLQDYAPKVGANETAKGFNLWDAEALIDDLKGWKRGKPNAPQWVSNLDAITGNRNLSDEIIAASRVQAANKPLGEVQSLQPRGLGSGTGVKIYTTLEYFPHKMLAAAYGSNTLTPFLRSLSRDIGEEAYQKNMDRMMKGIIGTRIGLNAAAQQSANDPEFAEQMQVLLSEIQAQSKQEQ